MRNPKSKIQNLKSIGFTLIELLVYVALFAVVVNISMSVYVGVSRISAAGISAINRLETVSRVRDDFLRTVHEAQSVVPAAAKYQTGPDQLVLELPPLPEQPGARRYVVWGRIGDAGRLARLEFAEKKDGADGHIRLEPLDYCSYRLPLTGLHFESGADTRMATMDLKVRPRPPVQSGKKTVGPPPVAYQFNAALRSRVASIGGTK